MTLAASNRRTVGHGVSGSMEAPPSAMERRTFLHGPVTVEREGSRSVEWEP